MSEQGDNSSAERTGKSKEDSPQKIIGEGSNQKPKSRESSQVGERKLISQTVQRMSPTARKMAGQIEGKMGELMLQPNRSVQNMISECIDAQQKDEPDERNERDKSRDQRKENERSCWKKFKEAITSKKASIIFYVLIALIFLYGFIASIISYSGQLKLAAQLEAGGALFGHLYWNCPWRR